MTQRRTELVQIRCTAEEKAAWKAAAGTQDLSEWIRRILTGVTDPEAAAPAREVPAGSPGTTLDVVGTTGGKATVETTTARGRRGGRQDW